jgi:hypothetical protein
LATVTNTFINSEYYKKSFDEADAYNKVVFEAFPSIMDSQMTEDSNATDYLIEQGIVYGVQKLFPPELLKTYNDEMIDMTINWLTSPPTQKNRVLETSMKKFIYFSLTIFMFLIALTFLVEYWYYFETMRVVYIALLMGSIIIILFLFLYVLIKGLSKIIMLFKSNSKI